MRMLVSSVDASIVAAASTGMPTPRPSAGKPSVQTSANPQASSTAASNGVTSGLPLVDIALLLLAVAAVLLIGWLAASRRVSPADPNADARAAFFQSPTWRFLQTTLIGLLLIAAAWHSLAASTGPDSTTVTFLVLVVIVTVVPIVEKITFPSSGEIDLISAQVKTAAVDLSQNARLAQIAFATAAQVIADAQAGLALQMRDPQLSIDDKRNLVERTLSNATATIAALLLPASDSAAAPVPGDPNAAAQNAATANAEQLRISAWVQTTDGTSLRYATGWPQALTVPLQNVISTFQGADPASVVFRTQQYLNYTDVADTQRPPGDGIVLRGILVLPLFAGAKVIGVLQMEREKAERFEPAQVALGRALAALYGFALA